MGVKERYEPRLSFEPVAASFTSLFTSARVFGVIVPDRVPLPSNTPSAGQQCSLGSLQLATPTKATHSACVCVCALVAIIFMGENFRHC